MKCLSTIVLSIFLFFALTMPVAAQDEADIQAGQAIADFYAAAKRILTETQPVDVRAGLRFGRTWDDVLYGTVDVPETIHAALSAAAKQLDAALARLPGRQLRLRGFSLASEGPELHFEVADQP